jgi:hypothetical protein
MGGAYAEGVILRFRVFVILKGSVYVKSAAIISFPYDENRSFQEDKDLSLSIFTHFKLIPKLLSVKKHSPKLDILKK